MKLSLYGKYAGKLKESVNYLNNCSEMELFIQISSLYEPIKMENYCSKMINFYDKAEDYSCKKYFENRLENYNKVLRVDNSLEHDEMIYALDYCILQSNRFNTNVSYNPNGRVIISEEFKNWYNNWQLYISTMDKDILAIYRICRYESKGLDKFHVNKPVEIDKIINEFDSIKPKSYQLSKKSTKQLA